MQNLCLNKWQKALKVALRNFWMCEAVESSEGGRKDAGMRHEGERRENGVLENKKVVCSTEILNF